MQRISSRLAAALLAFALLILPVSMQAAPSNSDTEAWGTSVTATFASWLSTAWDTVEGVFLPPADGGEPAPEGEGSTTESQDDSDKDIVVGMDPNG